MKSGDMETFEFISVLFCTFNHFCSTHKKLLIPINKSGFMFYFTAPNKCYLADSGKYSYALIPLH